MNTTYPIIFRLPKQFHDSAEEFLEKNGEKNFNALSKKLLIEAIEKSKTESKYPPSNFDDEHVQFLLAALGNSRELFLRVFEILFAGAQEKKQFENVIKELDKDWSVINRMFFERTSAIDGDSAIFSDEILAEVDNIFDTKFANSRHGKIHSSKSSKTENFSSRQLKQASLFD